VVPRMAGGTRGGDEELWSSPLHFSLIQVRSHLHFSFPFSFCMVGNLGAQMSTSHVAEGIVNRGEIPRSLNVCFTKLHQVIYVCVSRRKFVCGIR